MELTVLGSGSPLPDPNRAGPSGLVRAGGSTFLIDCGRGVLMRAAAAGAQMGQFTAVLLTHLHSDHVSDLNDVITTFWVNPFTAGRALPIYGPPGTAELVDRTLAMLRFDIGYRIDHHDDLTAAPLVAVTEVTDGVVIESDGVTVTSALVDHGVVKPALGYRIDHDGRSAVWSGDTLPCPGLDRLCAGADVYVQTVIRRDLVEAVPVQRFLDILDYHSDLEMAGQTATRGGVGTLVCNHLVPAPLPGTEGDWVAQVAAHYTGEVVLAEDLWTRTW